MHEILQVAVGWKDSHLHEFVVGDIRFGVADVEGGRAGREPAPPRDCGGAPGYSRLLRILADPTHAEHREIRTWVGRRFDPEEFDLAAIKEKLATLYERLVRHAR